MRRRVIGVLLSYGIIAAGCLVYAVSFNWFIKSSGFVMGGFTGIGQIINRLFPKIPVGSVILILNLPLIWLWTRRQGIGHLLPTVFAIFLNAIFIDSVEAWFPLRPMERIPSFLLGGGLMGLSLGIMLRQNATTGGTELLARLLKGKYRYVSMGRLCLIIDVIIIVVYALIFGEPENGVYGIITIFILSRVLDMVLYGSINARLAVIISDKSHAIAQAITALNIGATVLDGTGAWSHENKQVILCVCKYNNIAALQSAVIGLDPHVFFIICDARQVLGEGFATPDGDI